MTTNLPNTAMKRAQFKAQLDDFATFQWRGYNMFDEFGCFIINDDNNGNLKFYNGPEFSNQYSKSQFSKSTHSLLGVDWKQQTINFKVGLYWFTIEEYQRFIDCINPYNINYLTFDYDGKYGYLVKLANLPNSTRYVIGHTTVNGRSCPVYYTELDLKWELLGDSCVRSNLPYEWVCSCTNQKENEFMYNWKINPLGDLQDNSLLDTPLLFEAPIQPHQPSMSFKLQAHNKTINKTILLCDINLKNLPTTDEDNAATTTNGQFINNELNPLYQFFLRYDSETGLVYIQKGSDDSWFLLNYQLSGNGDYILESSYINKWSLPGVFSQENLSTTSWEFIATLNNATINYNGLQAGASNVSTITPTIYARKNVI